MFGMRKATFLVAKKATSLFAKKPTLLVTAYNPEERVYIITISSTFPG